MRDTRYRAEAQSSAVCVTFGLTDRRYTAVCVQRPLGRMAESFGARASSVSVHGAGTLAETALAGACVRGNV